MPEASSGNSMTTIPSPTSMPMFGSAGSVTSFAKTLNMSDLNDELCFSSPEYITTTLWFPQDMFSSTTPAEELSFKTPPYSIPSTIILTFPVAFSTFTTIFTV